MKIRSTLRAAALGLAIATVSGIPVTELAWAEPAVEPSHGQEGGEGGGQEVKQDARAIEIIEKSIERMGGPQRFKDIESVHQTGTIEVASAGMSGTLDIFVKTPDRFLMVVDLPGLGESRQGLNGDVAWSSDAMNGPRILPEAETRDVKNQADIASRLDFKNDYPTITYVSETEFDGKKAHQIKLIDTYGKESTEYYGIEHGYLLGSEQVSPTQMGPARTISYLREYKELGGKLQPTVIVQKIGTTEIVVTLKAAEYGAVEDSVFVMPDAVKALVEASKKDQSTDSGD